MKPFHVDLNDLGDVTSSSPLEYEPPRSVVSDYTVVTEFEPSPALDNPGPRGHERIYPGGSSDDFELPKACLINDPDCESCQ